MSNFDNDPRRKQELLMRPAIDRIYYSIFGDGITITRYEREENKILDISFAIDVRITMPNDMIITGQEKSLSHKYSSFGTVTVEYMQDWQNEVSGDWFKLAPQFYFVGYCNKDNNGFMPWVLLNWLEVILSSNNNKIAWIDQQNKDGRAKASFKYTKMKSLPDNCLIACSWKNINFDTPLFANNSASQ